MVSSNINFIFGLITFLYYILPLVASIYAIRKAKKKFLLFFELYSVFIIVETFLIAIIEMIVSFFVPSYFYLTIGLLYTLIPFFIPVLIFAFIYFLRKGAVQ